MKRFSLQYNIINVPNILHSTSIVTTHEHQLTAHIIGGKQAETQSLSHSNDMATPWLTNLTLPNVTLAPSLTISKSNQIKGLLELDKSNIITRKADSFVSTLHIYLAVESKQKRGKKTKGEVFFSFSTHLDVSLCLQLPTISSLGLC